MAKYSFDAIEIITNDGNGMPVAYTDGALGFVSGIFRARTGRYTITVAAGDSTVTSWATAILSEGGVSGGVAGDFETTPKIATTSGFSFSLINVADLIGSLQTAGVYLNNCVTKHYYVTSDDGSEWDFYLIQTGVIDRVSYDEGLLNIRCVPYFKSFLSKIARGKVDSTRFPSSPDNSRDKVLPLVYGRSPYSPMVPVISDTGLVATNYLSGEYHYATACVTYTPDVIALSLHGLTLKCSGMDYITDDPRIVGKYVNIIHGGVAQYRPIIRSWSDASGELTVAFSEELDVSTAFVGWTSGGLTNTVWYATITGYSASIVAADHDVYEIKSSPDGVVELFSFDSDKKEYATVSEIVEESSTENIDGTSLPGVSIIKTSETPGGEITTYRPIVFGSIEEDVPNTHDVTYVSGTIATDLTDRDRSTGVVWTKAANVAGGIVFNAYLPKDLKTPNADDFYFLIDFVLSSNYVTTRTVTISVAAVDIFGRDVSIVNYGLASMPTTGVMRALLPNVYYGEKPNPTYPDYFFHAYKDNLSIGAVFDLANPGLIYSHLNFAITISAEPSSGYTDTFSLREVGIAYKTSAAYANETVYAHQIGAKFETTWNARKTAASPVLLAGDIIEKMVRDHDLDVDVWEASRAYVVGDKVQPTADNKHTYRCTIAGTSSGSEPTWPTTAGATVTDGGVTWTEAGTYPIDEAAFDDINAGDRSWAYAGRTLDTETKTADAVESICKDFFIGIRPNKYGELSPIAFLEQTSVVAAFTNSNSFDYEGVEPTDQSQVFTELDLKYGWDNGSQSFNARLFVTNTDKPSFPAYSEPVDRGTSLGTFTITRTMPMPGFYYYTIDCDVPHGLSDGDYVYLTGNADGYDFTPRQIVWLDGYGFTVGELSGTTATSTSGSLYTTSSDALKWKSYVGGHENYSEASSLWERFRQNYLVLKTRNSAPKDISECYWIIDPKLTDPRGEYVWPDVASATTIPAYEYALRVANWSSALKARFAFSVDVTAANIALAAYDLITFTDPILTDGAQAGYIEEKKYIPRVDQKVNEHFRITMLAIPDYTADLPDRIIDTADAADRILDTADAADRILDTPQ